METGYVQPVVATPEGEWCCMARTERNLKVPETAELWRRWHTGQTLVNVARALDVGITTVSSCILRGGGVVPRRGKRSALTLTDDEREAISRALVQRWSFRRIAQKLERSPSTIAREVKR